MRTQFRLSTGVESVRSAYSYVESGRLVTAKKMPRSRERTEAPATPSPSKQLEQHL